MVWLLMKNVCDDTLHQLETLILLFLFPEYLQRLHAVVTVFSAEWYFRKLLNVAVVYFFFCS